MIKKLKIGLLIAVLSLAVGVGFANAAALLTWTADTTISMSSSIMDLTIASGSTAQSIVINAGTIVPTLASGDVFTVSTADITAGNFSVSPSTGVVPTGCSSGVAAKLVITATGTQAYTITPSSGKCVHNNGGGSSTITCGSGYTLVNNACVATVVTPPVTPPVVPPVVEVAGGCSGGNLFNTSTGAACVNNAGAEIPGCGNRNTGFSTASGVSCVGNRVATAGEPNAPGASGYNFGTKTLKNGSRGEAVMELQRFLNAKLGLGLVVDGKLGPKTIKVIKKWQKDNNLVADGLVGAKTKAKMNAEAN